MAAAACARMDAPGRGRCTVSCVGRGRAAVLALCLAVLAAPAAAQETWRCELPGQGGREWVSREMTIRIDGSEITVDNAITRFVVGGPAAGRVTRRSAEAIGLTWRLPATRRMTRGQFSSLFFTAVIDLPGGGFTATMRAPPSSRVFGGSGRCVRG